MTDTNQTPARVTREDVLAALGDTDPNRTNASAIRTILGRGGNTTIQKLLDEIRAERAAPPVSLDVAPPAVPAGLVDAVWTAAWSHAQVMALARMDRLTAERDGLAESVQVLREDNSALSAEVDALRDALQSTEAALSAQRESEGVKLAAGNEEVLRLSAQIAENERKVAELAQQMAHADELARRDAELKDAAHQRDQAHLLDQVAELKALLYRSAPPAAAK